MVYILLALTALLSVPALDRAERRSPFAFPLALLAAIRDRIRQIDPNQPLASIETMDARLGASVAQRRIEASVLAAFAGIISSIRTSAANPNSGTGYELEVIAMVVIGGTALTGGRGTIIGSVRTAETRAATPSASLSPLVMSPAGNRSTLNARSPSSTISANSAASAAFSTSSSPSSR